MSMIRSFRVFNLMCLQQLRRRDDLSPLTDPTWIAQVLSQMPSQVAQQEGAGTRWRGLGTHLEVSLLNGANAP